MPARAQVQAAKQNIKKAQQRWRSMSSRMRAHAQPEGRERERPGTGGEGEYYRVEVRRKGGFSSFRTQDVGRRGHVQRIAGHRPSGSWDTQAWLVSKGDAHVENGWLQGDTRHARKVLEQLETTPRRIRGDRFKARPRRDVPEGEKPTPAQRRARKRNIRKAQQARRKD